MDSSPRIKYGAGCAGMTLEFGGDRDCPPTLKLRRTNHVVALLAITDGKGNANTPKYTKAENLDTGLHRYGWGKGEERDVDARLITLPEDEE